MVRAWSDSANTPPAACSTELNTTPTPTNDELTQARRGRAEVQAKLERGGDAASCDYWRKVIAMWDDYIARLEAKHGTGEATVQTEH